jgi:hypothetical protein
MYGSKLAAWDVRVASAVIDYGPIFVLWLFGLDIAILVILAFLWTVANTVVIQGMSGQSLGKAVMGTQLILPVLTGEGALLACVPGVGRCAARLFGRGPLVPGIAGRWPARCLVTLAATPQHRARTSHYQRHALA